VNQLREVIDLKLQKFNKLMVIERCGSNKRNRALWLCKCDCGKEVIVESYRLRSGHTKSCGCQKSESTIKRNYSHGQSKTRLYRIWSLMNDRCKNPNTPCYERYGNRGIKVCEDWKKFLPFYEWSISNGYSSDLTIDRIDNSDGYNPNNCRWSNIITQNNNTRKNKYYKFNNESHTVAEWSRILNFNGYLFYNRIKTHSAQEVLKSLEY
jgi:hypothetical protein